MIELNEEGVNIGRGIDDFPLRIDDRERLVRRRKWRRETAGRGVVAVVTPRGYPVVDAGGGFEARRFRRQRESGANFVRRIEGILERVTRLREEG